MHTVHIPACHSIFAAFFGAAANSFTSCYLYGVGLHWLFIGYYFLVQLLATSLKNQQIASPVGISTAFGLHWLFSDYFFLVQLLAASLTMAVSKYVIESKAHQQYHHTNLHGVTLWSRASLWLVVPLLQHSFHDLYNHFALGKLIRYASRAVTY